LKPSSFTRQALRDVARIADRYDQEKEGLGDKFVERVYEAVDRIEANPEGYALEFRQLRRCNLLQISPLALLRNPARRQLDRGLHSPQKGQCAC
jgi:hypothetical protein